MNQKSVRSLGVMSGAGLAAFMTLPGVPAYGQDASPSSGTYQVPMGEQPEYGKKYYPSRKAGPEADTVLEINPLLLIQRGIGFEFEHRLGESFSLGADFIYRDAEIYDENSAKGRNRFLGVAPKFRLYPIQTLAGVFFGAKVTVGQDSSEVKAGGVKSTKDTFIVAPSAHVGYRFVSFNGFTVAGYVGAGVNIPTPEFEQEDLDARVRNSAIANEAREEINDKNGFFRPDFGLTVGVAL